MTSRVRSAPYDLTSPRVQFLSVRHVAELLEVSAERIRRLIRAEALPAIKVGAHWRIHKSAVGPEHPTSAKLLLSRRNGASGKAST